jgi:hypothetical protein
MPQEASNGHKLLIRKPSDTTRCASGLFFFAWEELWVQTTEPEIIQQCQCVMAEDIPPALPQQANKHQHQHRQRAQDRAANEQIHAMRASLLSLPAMH